MVPSETRSTKVYTTKTKQLVHECFPQIILSYCKLHHYLNVKRHIGRKTKNKNNDTAMLSSECLEKADEFQSLVDIQDRRYRFKTYRQCFVGREAVDAMIRAELVNSRQEAVELARTFERDLQLFVHVCEDHTFKDDYLFYRFRSNQEKHELHIKHPDKNENCKERRLYPPSSKRLQSSNHSSRLSLKKPLRALKKKKKTKKPSNLNKSLQNDEATHTQVSIGDELRRVSEDSGFSRSHSNHSRSSRHLYDCGSGSEDEYDGEVGTSSSSDVEDGDDMSDALSRGSQLASVAELDCPSIASSRCGSRCSTRYERSTSGSKKEHTEHPQIIKTFSPYRPPPLSRSAIMRSTKETMSFSTMPSLRSFQETSVSTMVSFEEFVDSDDDSESASTEKGKGGSAHEDHIKTSRILEDLSPTLSKNTSQQKVKQHPSLGGSNGNGGRFIKLQHTDTPPQHVLRRKENSETGKILANRSRHCSSSSSARSLQDPTSGTTMHTLASSFTTIPIKGEHDSTTTTALLRCRSNSTDYGFDSPPIKAKRCKSPVRR